MLEPGLLMLRRVVLPTPWPEGFLVLLLAALSANGQSPNPTNYTIRLSAGYNAIANNLSKGQNTLDELFPQMPPGTVLYKWNSTTQSYYAPAEYDGFWFSSDSEATILRPGEGAFLYLNTSWSVTISGYPASYSLPRPVRLHYNLIGGQRPGTLRFTDLFGFAPAPGDRVYKYDRAFSGNVSNAFDGFSSVHTFSETGWDVEPKLDTGKAAFVYISDGPHITKEPTFQTVYAGNAAGFSVSAISSEPLFYQWQFMEEDISGATLPNLTLPNVQYLQSGLYSVIVSNRLGSVTSRPATLRVLSPPVILKQPQSIHAIPGETNAFHVEATGSPPLRYQWVRNQLDIPGGTNATLKVGPLQASDVGEYFVRIRNGYGTNQSVTVTLAVNIPPFIRSQPASLSTRLDGPASFSVVAGGTAPLYYQWRLNGRYIPGETNETLSIAHVKTNQAGAYQVLVVNEAGAVESDVAFLSLELPPLPFQDKFDAAVVRTDSFFCGMGNNLGATREIGEPRHAGRFGNNSVWLRWVPRQRGIVTFSTSGSSFDTVLAAYIGDSFATLSEVAADDDQGDFFTSRISFAADPERIYSIAVDGVDGAQGEIVLCWSFEPTDKTVPLPIIIEQPRDQIASSGQPVSFSVKVLSSPGTQLQYQWYFNGIPQRNSVGPTLTIDSATPKDVGSYFVIISDGTHFVKSRIATLQFSFAGADNTRYGLLTYDKFADVIIRPVGQPNGYAEWHTVSEDSMQAQTAEASSPILGYTGTQIFSTVGAGTEPGERHCGTRGGASEWFAFVAPADGALYLNTEGSNFDTLLAVYTGSPPPFTNLTSVACDNDSGSGSTSSLSMDATQDTIYYIAVDGVNGATGTAYLNYRLLVPITIVGFAKTNATTVRFRVNATPAYPLQVQRSAAMSTWLTLLTTNLDSGTFVFRDTNATPAKRFYRALQIP